MDFPHDKIQPSFYKQKLTNYLPTISIMFVKWEFKFKVGERYCAYDEKSYGCNEFKNS